MTDSISMTTKEAILYVSTVNNIPSMYRLSRELSDDLLKVTTTQISNYLKGTRMSRKVADRFAEIYDVTVTDVYDNGSLRKNYSKGI